MGNGFAREAHYSAVAFAKFIFFDIANYFTLFLLQEDLELFPKDSDGNILFSEVDYVDTWKALEKCQQKGLVKSIGISNFNKKQIERVLAIATVKPVINQVSL